LQSFAVDYKA